MDGSTAREIKTAHHECPAVGVPCPAGDGVVYNCGPNEGEDDRGAKACTLGNGAQGDHGCDSREHELEDAERDGGNAAAADGRLFKDALEAEVFCVADMVNDDAAHDGGKFVTH